MASFSNLFADAVQRMRNDETGEVVLVFTRDGLPMNISEMAFSIGYCKHDTIEESKRFDIGLASVQPAVNAELKRPADTTNQLVLDISPANRAALADERYTCYLYDHTSGKRDPLGVWTHEWLTKPAPFVPGQPREPAQLQIDFVTSTGATTILPIYVLPGLSLLSVSSYGNMLATNVVSGALLVEVTADERWGDTDTLYLVTVRAGVTRRRKIVLMPAE